MRKLLSNFALFFIGIVGFSFPVHAQHELSASLKPTDSGVAFYLTNQSNSSVSILRWETPLEGELTQDIFSLTPARNGKSLGFGQKAVFTGRVFKRDNPGPDDYVVLAPGETIRADVTLADYYQVESDGLYMAEFTGRFQVEQHSFGQRTVRSSHSDKKAIAVETDSVAVNLVATPVIRFARAGDFHSSCSASQQTELTADIDASEDITIAALDAMRNLPESERPGSPRYLQWFGTYSASRYNTVMQTYETAAARMADGSVEFNCSCDEQFFAFVYPIDPYKVYLCNAYWNASRLGTDSRAGTILHELSHFNEVGGTDDHAYGAVAVANLARANPSNAVNNADSIEYFAENTPFREISAGETAPPQLVEYQTLQPGTEVTGTVAEGDRIFFEASGADSVELTTVSGDADLFVYSTPSRDTLLCDSLSTTALDSCELSSASTAYIEVLGYRASSFSIVATQTAPQNTPAETLPVGETVTRSVAQGEDQMFIVSDADVVIIESLSGNADLYVHSDSTRLLETCNSLVGSSESVFDECPVTGGTFYVTVFGFTAAEYTITTRSILPEGPIDADGFIDADNGDGADVDEGAGSDNGSDIEVVNGEDTTPDSGSDTVVVNDVDTTPDNGSDMDVVNDGDTTPDSGSDTVVVNGGDTTPDNGSDMDVVSDGDGNDADGAADDSVTETVNTDDTTDVSTENGNTNSNTNGNTSDNGSSADDNGSSTDTNSNNVTNTGNDTNTNVDNNTGTPVAPTSVGNGTDVVVSDDSTATGTNEGSATDTSMVDNGNSADASGGNSGGGQAGFSLIAMLSGLVFLRRKIRLAIRTGSTL